MGAKACAVCLAYLYGLGAYGQSGVEKALSILRTEIERDMALLGATKVSDINQEFVRKR